VLSADVDPAGIQFRLRSVQSGVSLTLFSCVSYGVYYVLTWDRPHRALMLVVITLALLASLALGAAPLEGLMRRALLREAFFLGWSASLLVIITTGAMLDGGAESVLVVALFLPLAFAALSYPLGSMLAIGAMAIGAYLAIAATSSSVLSPETFFMVGSLACATWMCGWQARNHDLQRRELARVSRSDPLTGCLNRRGFEEHLAAELNRAERAGTPLGLILFDLDDFKATNDRNGHAAGDALLCHAVATISSAMRPADALGRLGGDEFALLVPGAGPAEAIALADRLRTAMALDAPASIGVGTYPADGLERDALHQIADADLYAAKRGSASRSAPAGARELRWAATLARAVDARMAVRHEHSASVARYAAAIAHELGWVDDHIGRLRLAATLHDIGKIAVPEAVLRRATH